MYPPVYNCPELSLARGKRSQIPLAAKSVILFTKCDFMTSLRGDKRCFQPGDTAANYKDILWFLNLFKLILCLPANFRILQTIRKECCQKIINTSLVTADTLPDILGSSFLSFFRPIRICDQRP